MPHVLASSMSVRGLARARFQGRVVNVSGEERVYDTVANADVARQSAGSGRGRGRGRGRGGMVRSAPRADNPTAGWVSSVVTVAYQVTAAQDTTVVDFAKFVILGPTLVGHHDVPGLTGVDDVKIQGVRLEVVESAFSTGFARYAAAVTVTTAATTATPAAVKKVAGSAANAETNSIDVWHNVGISGMETLRKTGGPQGTLVANLATQLRSEGMAATIDFTWHITILKPSGAAEAVHVL